MSLLDSIANILQVSGVICLYSYQSSPVVIVLCRFESQLLECLVTNYQGEGGKYICRLQNLKVLLFCVCFKLCFV